MEKGKRTYIKTGFYFGYDADGEEIWSEFDGFATDFSLAVWMLAITGWDLINNPPDIVALDDITDMESETDEFGIQYFLGYPYIPN